MLTVPSRLRVAPPANTDGPVPSDGVGWVWWLSGPIIATVLAALWSWVRGRPKPQLNTPEAMQEHRDYLEALSRAPRHASHERQSQSR